MPKGEHGPPTARRQHRYLQNLAREYTEEALDGILRLARSGKSEYVRLAAWQMLLERGWGKPTTQHEHTHRVESLEDLSDEEQQALLEDARERYGHQALINMGKEAIDGEFVEVDREGEGDPETDDGEG